MKKSTKSPMKKPVVKKAQMGKSVKPTADSTEYFGKKRDSYMKLSEEQLKKGKGEDSALSIFIARRAGDNAYRQSKKGKPGYNEHGYSTFKPKSPKQQISENVKAKKK
jgi:hypothetical protein